MYTIDKNTKFKFITFLLLNEIINASNHFPIILTGDDLILEDNLKFMLHNKLIEQKEGRYVQTASGKEYLKKFLDRYYEYLKMYDLYCAVDLAKGEFAFASFFEASDDDEWAKILNEDRFKDVRIAVAEFKKIDPLEIVFMSFLNEDRFNTEIPGWQENIAGDNAWKEIEDICNTAISVSKLEEGENKGVIEDIVKKGNLLMKDILLKEQEMFNKSEVDEEVTETTTTTTTIVEDEYVEIPSYGYSYFEPYYYDPFYISPIWDPFYFDYYY